MLAAALRCARLALPPAPPPPPSPSACCRAPSTAPRPPSRLALLSVAFFILINALRVSSQLMVTVQRRELRDKQRKQQQGEARADGSKGKGKAAKGKAVKQE